MTIAPLGDGWFGNERARARLRRDGEDIVVEPFEHDGGDARDAFLNSLGAMVTDARRIVDADGSVLLDVSVNPVESKMPLTLSEIEAAIRASWSAETSDDAAGWSDANPAYQQCDVTAHVVCDYLGGEILACGVVRDGRRVDRHAWNLLASGVEVDLTREQFRAGEQFEAPEVMTSASFLGASHQERYHLLASRVRALLEGV